MAFPPAFDRAWDETFPPDTQAANLLGQDIRNFKTDIRERLSLLSGTFANRPSNMDAIYGGASFGVLYFSTDTKQIFQWSGAAWVDVTSSFAFSLRFSDTTITLADNPTTVLKSVTIPAGTLRVGSAVTLFCKLSQPIGPTVKTVNLNFGATSLGSITPGVGNGGVINASLVVSGASAEEAAGFSITNVVGGGASSFSRLSSPTENIANAINVQLLLNDGTGTYELSSNLLGVIVSF